MNTIWSTVAVLMVAGVLRCYAATNDLEAAVANFPKVNAWDYRPDLASQSANTLIKAGEAAACRAIESCVGERRERRQAHVGFDDKLSSEEDAINRNACHLCRLLFTPTNSVEPLRPPRIGAMQDVPYESMKPTDWPVLPFAVVEQIPLTMSLGYVGSGIPERAENYLAYCKVYGRFRTGLFIVPTYLTASNALTTVFKSPSWKGLKWTDEGQGWRYSIDEADTKQRLWRQVENMANKHIQPTPR